ncbi:hypothetical protein MSAN_00957500 [Mycena sanguinolenta]|uniref:Uncharacterized protein n=1 Tax=Mycena sanguinolenta TaxID=230812 RepID=A0A8H7DBR0_9AGAR|nr:hypothetical protein MSAN_00957500 [Mycena sanguinolenta]
MFILPAHAHPFDAASSSFPFSWSAASNGLLAQWILSPLRLALTLLATLLVFMAVRRVLSARFGAKKAVVTVPVSEKQGAPPADSTTEKRSWRGLLPSLNVTTLAEALPITLNGPPPPPMRGRHVYRGGRGVGFNVSTRRPEAALATRPRVEAPLPAIYESETPVSMAKMIMSRHTYRTPLRPAALFLRTLPIRIIARPEIALGADRSRTETPFS